MINLNPSYGTDKAYMTFYGIERRSSEGKEISSVLAKDLVISKVAAGIVF
jgi:hypothetical protein